jgi:putative ABC transport system ATP-binding protein
VVLVTHEPDIARYTRRIVELRDGHVIRDEALAERHRAADDLARFREPEEAS